MDLRGQTKPFSWRRVVLTIIATPLVIGGYVAAEMGLAIRKGVIQGMEHASNLWDEATRL
jgi:hypothetical protein